MRNERLRHKKLAKARKRRKDYERHVNAERRKPREDRSLPLTPGIDLPKSGKVTPKKEKIVTNS